MIIKYYSIFHTNHTHTDDFPSTGTQLVHIKRVKEMGREVFKIVNNIAPTFIENLIVLKRSQHSLRNDKSAVILRANTTKYGLNARIWNSLPNVFRVNEIYREFSRLIQNWSGPTIKCITRYKKLYLTSVCIYRNITSIELLSDYK